MGADIGFEPSVSADCRAVRENKQVIILEAENLIELVSEQTEDAKKSSNTAFSYHMRAVLLTWNIRIRGIKDDLWNDILPDMLVFFDLFIWRLGT